MKGEIAGGIMCATIHCAVRVAMPIVSIEMSFGRNVILKCYSLPPTLTFLDKTEVLYDENLIEKKYDQLLPLS